MVPVDYYIALSAVLFVIGSLGVLVRRNPLIIFMSIELMLNAANLAFVAFASAYGTFRWADLRLLRHRSCRGGGGGRTRPDRGDLQIPQEHQR
jgi:hypothetical protein